MKIHTITLIGAGNVASNLGRAFLKNGYDICGVFSRNKTNADDLAEKLKTFGIDNIGLLPKESDLYILAVNDDAIPELIPKIYYRCTNKISIVHTAGSVTSEIFRDYFIDFGVIYYLQTFSKGIFIDLGEIPCFITASSKKFEKSLLEISLSSITKVITDQQRKILHLAAVFSNNFVNYMSVISHDILTNNEIDPNYLNPLVNETIRNILYGNDPWRLQTGPAMRGDERIINDHLEMLKSYPEYFKIYNDISQSIISKKAKPEFKNQEDL